MLDSLVFVLIDFMSKLRVVGVEKHYIIDCKKGLIIVAQIISCTVIAYK